MTDGDPTNKPSICDLNTAMQQAASELFGVEVEHKKGWYVESKEVLEPILQKERELYEAKFDNPTEENKQALNEARKASKIAKKEAIAKHLDQAGSAINAKSDPKEAWKITRNFEAGLCSHWRTPQQQYIVNKNGILPTDKAESAQNHAEHRREIHNREDAPVDWSVLEEIKQRPIDTTIGNPPPPETK